MNVLNALFASFEDTAKEFDKQRMQAKNEVDEYQQIFDQQMRSGATKEQKQMTLDSVNKIDKKQAEFAAKIVGVEISKDLVEFAFGNINNLLQTDLLDEKRRSKGLNGRHDIRNACEIMNEFMKKLS